MRWFVLAILMMPGLVFAQGKGGPKSAAQGKKEEVQIALWTVHASNKHQTMDARLKRIAKHLGNLKFSGFDLLAKQGAALKVKAKTTFNIVGKRSVEITVLSRDEKRARVRVAVMGANGKLLDTTVSIRRNGFFMVAGPAHKGGILVLPIFARY